VSQQRRGWHDDAFFGIHYDLHAKADDTNLGGELTPEHLRQRLERIRPDWVQCDCKGHPGYTSWPTKVGSTSPGVVRDQLRIYRDVTRELGIRLGVHYSGIWDARAVELHPDWARVGPGGQRHDRHVCVLSDYAEKRMIPQMLEILDVYDVDGFWVDGDNWADAPCWCGRCTAEFTRRTGIEAIPAEAGDPHWDEWLAFHRDLFVEYVDRYAGAIHERKPDCAVCSNWMCSSRQPEAVRAGVDYLSGDTAWGWGAATAAIEGRVFDAHGLSWDLTAWMKTKVGDRHDRRPWAIKTAAHLCQELAEPVSLGGSVMVYENPQRSGRLTGWHHEIIAEVADFCRARRDACVATQTASEAAVLHLAGHFYSVNEPLFGFREACKPVQGALEALLECGLSADVLLEYRAAERLGDYKLIVVPEQMCLSAEIADALEAFARAGGNVLISGAHLATECPQLVGAGPDGAAAGEQLCLAVGDRAVLIGAAWQPVAAAEGTEVLARAMAHQDVPTGLTAKVTVTRRFVGKGSILAVHGPLFEDYGRLHYPLLRRLVGQWIEALGIEWEVRVDGPSWLELIVRRRGDALVVNLINRGAGEALAPDRAVLECLPPVRDVTVRVRRALAPRSVCLVPGGADARWSFGAGVVEIEVPEVAIHTAVVVG
jgi:alpha-L-fucosidase